MGHDHSHGVQLAGNERRLLFALGLTTLFMVAEIVGGILTNSLALLSDAAHMFTDVTALAISLAAVRIGRRAPDDQRSFGYRRLEILAAAFNAVLLFAVAGYILYEAWLRFRAPPAIESGGMFWVAVAGLVINLIAMRPLSGGKEESLNVKGAYLEVWSDLLGSIGVIAAALIIRFTGWSWVDPLVAVGIGFWVLPRTWTLLKASTHILLEGTPADVDLDRLRSDIESAPGVEAIHDLHVWTLTSGKHLLTAHVVTNAEAPADLLSRLAQMLEERFNIVHSTIQLENAPCGDLDAELQAAAPVDANHDHDDHAGHAH